MTQRTDRIDELLRQEIGAILTREVKDPRVGFATVTKVETTPDLRHARVWVSLIGQKGEREQTLAALEGVMHFVRRELGTRLRLRRIPDFHVRLDDSAERGTRLLHLIGELEAGELPLDEPAPEGETLPTPVARVRREDDAPDEPTAPGDAPGPPAAARRRTPARASGATGRRPGASGRRAGATGRPTRRRDGPTRGGSGS